MEYAVIRKNMKTSEFIHVYQDLPEIHKIRGRLLNLSTILECFMKFYLQSKKIKFSQKMIDYSKRGKDGVFNKFLDEIKKDKSISKKGLKSFEKHFKILTSKRNNFGHGLIYYKNKKKIRPYNINNNILNPFPPKNLSAKPINDSLNKNRTVFDDLNKSYEYVFDWLEKNKILKMEGFEILKIESKIKMNKVGH
ncbi:MAG: hypothetical protein COT80_02515 [Candidatus Buchananbacteria bacterium CG10_big_fil_rev_8_21_14_0_10_33_19]|uniref:Uncharacterized protein n=1 Tax=Candidatus Buchananbacteria bacterium CG10_big_fil_rev_8_21_14_0_10_33_19 TaxID=1974525 RepID=A0A2H0W412_9BACT|nr:MAG: hypothetical protein COT80_02515 [Candidatus Buchananbacteria bacterium CG10_big_fil_rev_8_21_14_0_10_33_19]